MEENTSKKSETLPRRESGQSDSSQSALRVAEGLGKDVGRGLARLDPKDLENLGIKVGDIIQIKGKRATVAKVMPAFKEARGKGIIQIDGITRANAGVSLDEKITVAKVFPKPASKQDSYQASRRVHCSDEGTGFRIHGQTSRWFALSGW